LEAGHAKLMKVAADETVNRIIVASSALFRAKLTYI